MGTWQGRVQVSGPVALNPLTQADVGGGPLCGEYKAIIVRARPGLPVVYDVQKLKALVARGLLDENFVLTEKGSMLRRKMTATFKV